MQYASVPQTLEQASGVIVRQQHQIEEVLAQSFGIPYEKENRYKVSLLPYGRAVKNHPHDPNGWEPSAEELVALDPFLFAREKSSCGTRALFACLGCGPMRPLQIHFSVRGATGDVYLIDRPFKCGGACCMPLEMHLSGRDASGHGELRRIGRVRENFAPYFSKCMSSCCLATTYTDIDRAMPDGSYVTQYQLRTNLSCCGRVNNCCGATCCKNDAVYDILDAQGNVVAHLQMTFASGSNCMGACCRAELGYNNYLLEFPHDATAEDRILLLTALFQVEYQHFERTGEDDS